LCIFEALLGIVRLGKAQKSRKQPIWLNFGLFFSDFIAFRVVFFFVFTAIFGYFLPNKASDESVGGGPFFRLKGGYPLLNGVDSLAEFAC
jgi:hypothetical protein